jgi:hypothetical protein
MVMRGLRLACCGLVFLCCGTQPIRAQNAEFTGTLTGVVTDPSGARVTDASVNISGARANLRVASDRIGRFAVPDLPVGAYEVTVEMAGFREWDRQVTIVRGVATDLRVKLEIAASHEVIDVTPEVRTSTSAADNKSAQVFDEDRLADLSDDNATFQQQLTALAGGDPSRLPDVYVDGFTGGGFPTKNSIREVRINQNPFSAEFPSYGGNRIEIFTRPGGSTLHGKFFVIGNDAPFNGNNPYTAIEPPYYSWYLDGELSGSFNKKTSFYTNTSYHKMQNNSVVDAISPITLGSLSEAVSAPDNTLTCSGRLDRQVTTNNSLTMRYSLRQEQLTNAGVGLLVLPTEGYNSTNTLQILQIGDTQSVSPKVVVESRFQYIRSRVAQQAQDSSPTLIVEGAFSDGGSSVGISHDNQDHFQFQEYVSVSRSRHFIRMGAQYDLLRDANEATTNYNGTYLFPTLAAYQAQAPTQFSVSAGQPSAVLQTGWLAAYVEDEWKALKNVTVNAGLRFESQSAIPDHADWAPRIGFAWAVGQKDKTAPAVVLRAAFGIFYDRFPAADLLTSVRQNAVTQQTFLVDDPAFYPAVPSAATLESGAGAVPPTPYTVSPHLHAEYDEDASVSAERSLGKIANVSLTYLWARGIHQYISENINAPLPGTYNPSVPNSGVRPLGGTQNIYQFDSEGIAKGQLLLANGNVRLGRRFSLFAFYQLQNERDDIQSSTSFPSNSYDLAADFGRSGRIGKSRLFVDGSVSLPWQISMTPFLVAGTGIPFNITTGTDLNGDTIYNDRPAFATDLSRPSVVRTPFGIFDTDPIAGQTIIPRNDGHSPGYLQVNLEAEKTIGIGPRALGKAVAGKPAAKGDRPYALKLACEVQNLLNSVNPGQPIGVLNSPLFGKPDSLNNFFTALGAANRVVDLALTFQF